MGRTFDKVATTVEQQMQLLLGRGMTCGDLAMMQAFLTTVGYYRLSAYWLPLELPPAEGQTRSKSFPPGVTFEQVVATYIFDRKLRLALMEGIERIEIAVRSRWTNRMTLAYGPHAHMNAAHFNCPIRYAERLVKLNRDVGNSNEIMIKHYRKNYERPELPPLWSVTETMTIGDLSKWLAETRDPSLQSAVARDLGLPARELLIGSLEVFSLIRNICAHHGRLWNRRLVKRLPFVRRLKDDLVVEGKAGTGQMQLSNLIYNPMVVLLHLLHHQNTDTGFPRRLRGLVETVGDHERALMGFPADWRARPAWRLS
jgi:abortive infection bacteriophage resistance protein